MHGHAARRSVGPVGAFLGQALFVLGVAGFVQDAHQRGQELVGAVARRHSHIGRHAAGEWVVRDVEPSMGEVEADGFGQVDAEGALVFD